MKNKKLCCLLLAGICLFNFSACSSSSESAQSTLSQSPEVSVPAITSTSSISNAQIPLIEPLAREGMRQFGNNAARTKNGFFSIEQEVLTDFSIADTTDSIQNYLGARVFYNDFNTMQSYPIKLPNGTEDGYLCKQGPTFSDANIYTTNDKIVLYFNGTIAIMNYDLTDYQVVYALNDNESIEIESVWVNNEYIYIIEQDYGNYVDSPILQFERIDFDTLITTSLTSHFYTEFTYVRDSSGFSSLNDKIILMQGERASNSSYNINKINYFELNLETEAFDNFHTVEGDNLRFEPIMSGNFIPWIDNDSQENILHEYNLDNGKTTSFTLPENFTPAYFAIWDSHILLIKDNFAEDGERSSSSYCNLDFTTGAISEPYTQESSNSSSEYPIIIAEYQDQYIVTTKTLYGTAWTIDESGNLINTEIPREEYSKNSSLPTSSSSENDYVPLISDIMHEYALIKKEDYWKNNFNYSPLVYV